VLLDVMVPSIYLAGHRWVKAILLPSPEVARSLQPPRRLHRQEAVMLHTRSVTTILIAGLLAFGCAKRTLVQVPARVDLHELGTIGIVEFASGSEGKLAAFSTQRFIEALQESQPGVHVLELGKIPELPGGSVDHAAIRAIGEKYDVDALIVGNLKVEEVRPNVDVVSMVKSMSVSADVDAALTARLFETGRGATVWTRSTRATRTVAHVGMGGGKVVFDARDPKGAYGELVDCLVNEVTDDFRVSYVRQ